MTNRIELTSEERKAYKAFRSDLTAELKETYGPDFTSGILYGDKTFLTAKDILIIHVQTIDNEQDS